MLDEEFERKVTEIRELEAEAGALEARIGALRDAVKAEMEARGVEEAAAGVFRVFWTRFTQRSFDVRAFREDHAELYRGYVRERASRRFSIV